MCLVLFEEGGGGGVMCLDFLTAFHREQSVETSPGYNFITGEILQELPPIAIKFITQLFNASHSRILP
jgi:hypothetical protein